MVEQADQQDSNQRTSTQGSNGQVMASKALTEEVSDEIQSPNDAAKFNLRQQASSPDAPNNNDQQTKDLEEGQQDSQAKDGAQDDQAKSKEEESKTSAVDS